MATDVPIIITSVYTLAKVPPETAEPQKRPEKHETSTYESGVKQVQDKQTLQKIDSAVEKGADVPEKSIPQSEEIYGINQPLRPLLLIQNIHSPSSTSRTIDIDVVGYSGARDCDGPRACPSFCCRKNTPLVQTLRAREHQKNVEKKTSEQKPAGHDRKPTAVSSPDEKS